MTIAGLILGATVFASHADAGDRKGSKHRRVEVRHEHRDHRYFRTRDVVVIRDYYRPYYRPLPRNVRYRYDRGRYLPPGWAKRVRPVPVYLERELVAVPRGYRRGLIDGRAVVFDNRGFILDVAVLF